MSNDSTKTMLAAYRPESLVHQEFTKRCTQINFETEAIEIDIERDDEEVAVVVTSLESGARANESSLYTNKEFLPAIYKEKISVPASKLLKRLPENTTHASIDFQAAASALSIRNFPKLEKKLRRAVEIQASQVFQTGTLILKDDTGADAFKMSFSPKAAHFPTVGTSWANPAADAPADIGNLTEVIHRNGKALPTRLTFGKSAWRYFLANTAVKSLLDKQVLNRGALERPEKNIGRAIKHGEITIDGYTYELFTYNGWYKDPQSGAMVPFLADDKIVLDGEGTSIVSGFGAVPLFKAQDGGNNVLLPPRISGDGFSFTPTGWISQDRETMTLQLSSRSLVVPKGIDTFGCLDVVP